MRYSETVIEHVVSPRNGGPMEAPDRTGKADVNGQAPRVTIYLRLDGDRIQKAMFLTFGCGAAIASASVLTELVAGRTIAECAAVTPEQIIERLGGLPPEKEFCAGVVVAALRNALLSG